MFSGRKLSISLSCMLLLSLQHFAQVRCVVEEEPPPPSPKVTTPSTGATGGAKGSGGKGGSSSGTATSSTFVGEVGYTPYMYHDSLGRPNSGGSCYLTILSANATEYDTLCGHDSNPKWPCFTHDGENDLSFVEIEPWWEPIDMSNEIVLRDPNNAKDFTLRNASVAFTILYQNNKAAKLRYYDYEPDTGCYKIHLSGSQEGRIHVFTTNRDYRDIDTAYYAETGKKLCSKFISIGTRNTDRSVLDWHDSDNSGI